MTNASGHRAAAQPSANNDSTIACAVAPATRNTPAEKTWNGRSNVHDIHKRDMSPFAAGDPDSDRMTTVVSSATMLTATHQAHGNLGNAGRRARHWVVAATGTINALRQRKTNPLANASPTLSSGARTYQTHASVFRLSLKTDAATQHSHSLAVKGAGSRGSGAKAILSDSPAGSERASCEYQSRADGLTKASRCRWISPD